jgi:ribosomal protein S18 acetylase RimI-like enzyme
VIVRDVLPGELAEVGEIRVSAYVAGGHMSPDSEYAPVLRALGSADDGTVLVAVADQADGSHQGHAHNHGDQGDGHDGDHGDGHGDHGDGHGDQGDGQGDGHDGHHGHDGDHPDHGDRRILGTIMIQRSKDGGFVIREDEAEVRALAVTPEGQGKGTGSALLLAAIERAGRAGVRNLVLLTQPDMRAAQHLYQKAGFRRLPERDWSPRPGFTLLAYGLRLNTGR